MEKSFQKLQCLKEECGVMKNNCSFLSFRKLCLVSFETQSLFYKDNFVCPYYSLGQIFRNESKKRLLRINSFLLFCFKNVLKQDLPSAAGLLGLSGIFCLLQDFKLQLTRTLCITFCILIKSNSLS